MLSKKQKPKTDTKKYLGDTTDYLNSLKFVQFFSEQYLYYNDTLIESGKNNIEKFEIFLIVT